MKIYNYSLIILIITVGLSCPASAQVMAQKIGNNPTNKEASAVLELESTNKGTLLTRVTLTGTLDQTTIAAPVNGLTVFNTLSAGAGSNIVTPGYYFWSGPDSKWVRLIDEPANNTWLLTGNGNTNSTTNFLGTTNSQDLIIKTNNTEQMRINAAGNVGIGTSPISKLDVIGNAFITDKLFPRSAPNGRSAFALLADNLRPYTDVGLRLYDVNSNSHLKLDAIGHGEIQSYGVTGAPTNALEDAGSESDLYLNPRGGNVGIATTAATERLDVGSGSVRIREITTSVGDISTDRVVVADASGVWKTIASANVISKSASYPLTRNDETVLASPVSGVLTITLPVASTVRGKRYYVKKIVATGTVRVISAGGNIDGNASATGISWTTNATCYGFQSNGTQWYIISIY